MFVGRKPRLEVSRTMWDMLSPRGKRPLKEKYFITFKEMKTLREMGI